MTKLLRLQPISSTKTITIIIIIIKSKREREREREEGGSHLIVRLSTMSGCVSKIFCSSSKETEPLPSVSAYSNNAL